MRSLQASRQWESPCLSVHRPASRATIRYVPPEATTVSFFCFYESVVDTPRLFGVKSATSLVMGTLRVVNHRFVISGVSLFLSRQTGLPFVAQKAAHGSRRAGNRLPAAH